MEEKDRILKTKKKLIILLLIYLSIAFLCIGVVFYAKCNNNEEKTVNLAEIVSNGTEKDGQYVEINIAYLPELLMSNSKDYKTYYVIDTHNNLYIMRLSKETFDKLKKISNEETKKLNKTYQVKGITHNMDEETKAFVKYSSDRIFKNYGLNSNDFFKQVDKVYVVEKNENISNTMVTIYQILALLALFFLVLAFGYVVPNLIKVCKGDFGIFDEKNMKEALEKYLPDGEELIANMHCIGTETETKQVFKNCILFEGKLIPIESDIALEIKKCKYSRYDMYIGITQHNLIIAECKPCKHYYEFKNIKEVEDIVGEEIKTDTNIEDIGHCFLLAEIQKCTVKNALMGAINCSISFKNGDLIKINIPKSGGLGMSHHTENRELIIECLSSKNS